MYEVETALVAFPGRRVTPAVATASWNRAMERYRDLQLLDRARRRRVIDPDRLADAVSDWEVGELAIRGARARTNTRRPTRP